MEPPEDVRNVFGDIPTSLTREYWVWVQYLPIYSLWKPLFLNWSRASGSKRVQTYPPKLPICITRIKKYFGRLSLVGLDPHVYNPQQNGRTRACRTTHG